MPIRLKRAYESPGERDGFRVLVDRIWPRGVSKEDLRLDAWMKEVAPSSSLRKWYGHDPERWEEFKDRYFRELDSSGDQVSELLDRAGQGVVTLVYGARDTKQNNAAALKEYLEKRTASFVAGE